jgi:hypothetical protein
MNPLYNPLKTHPILTGREMSMEPYPNRPFGFIDDPERQPGPGSVPTRIRTRSDGPDPLLTLYTLAISCEKSLKLWEYGSDCADMWPSHSVGYLINVCLRVGF